MKREKEKEWQGNQRGGEGNNETKREGSEGRSVLYYRITQHCNAFL